MFPFDDVIMRDTCPIIEERLRSLMDCREDSLKIPMEEGCEWVLYIFEASFVEAIF